MCENSCSRDSLLLGSRYAEFQVHVTRRLEKLKLSLTRLPMASNENFHLERLDVDLAWHQTSSLLQNFTPIVFLLIKPCLTSALRNNLFQDITSTHKQLHSICPISIIWLQCFPVLLLLQMLPGSQWHRKCGVLKLFLWGREEREERNGSLNWKYHHLLVKP